MFTFFPLCLLHENLWSYICDFPRFCNLELFQFHASVKLQINYKYREKFSRAIKKSSYLQRSPFDQTEQPISNFCSCIQLDGRVIQIRLRRACRIHPVSTDIPKRKRRCNRRSKRPKHHVPPPRCSSPSLKISCGSLALLKPIVRRSLANVEITSAE